MTSSKLQKQFLFVGLVIGFVCRLIGNKQLENEKGSLSYYLSQSDNNNNDPVVVDNTEDLILAWLGEDASFYMQSIKPNVEDYCHWEAAWDPSMRELCQNITQYSPQTLGFPLKRITSYGRKKFMRDVTGEITMCLDEGLRGGFRDDDQGDDYDDGYRFNIDDENFYSRIMGIPSSWADEKDFWGLDALEVVRHHSNSSGVVLGVEVANALPPSFAFAVKTFAGCVRTHLKDTHWKHRSFGGGTGNDCTFMASLLQKFLPGVAARIQMVGEFARQWAEWDLLDPEVFKPVGECGLRTTEHLAYGTFTNAGLQAHTDAESIYTVLFALSDPITDYSGGEFFVVSEGYQHYFRPAKYSAVVFLSEVSHGVASVTSGHREMFTNEFWRHGDAPYPQSRPTPQGYELLETLLRGKRRILEAIGFAE